MSERKFRVWEVVACVSGNLTTVARFPFALKSDADNLARNSQGGYVLPANLSRCLTLPEVLANPDKRRDANGTRVAIVVAEPLPLPPVPTPQQWV